MYELYDMTYHIIKLYIKYVCMLGTLIIYEINDTVTSFI